MKHDVRLIEFTVMLVHKPRSGTQSEYGGDLAHGWPIHDRKHQPVIERRRKVAAWIAENIMPVEPDVRRWLHRSRVSPDDIDDLIQEAYCQLARLDSIESITKPQAYFFSIVRNLLMRRLRRAKIVSFETMAEIDSYVDDKVFSPEREVSGRIDLARVHEIMATLPERCRRVVELRKFEGLSQKEIALKLSISESIVENEIHAGVRRIVAAWMNDDASAIARPAARGRGDRA